MKITILLAILLAGPIAACTHQKVKTVPEPDGFVMTDEPDYTFVPNPNYGSEPEAEAVEIKSQDRECSQPKAIGEKQTRD